MADRYAFNRETGVIHDRSAPCDDAQAPDLEMVPYSALRTLRDQGADFCDHCFRIDPLNEQDGDE